MDEPIDFHAFYTPLQSAGLFEHLDYRSLKQLCSSNKQLKEMCEPLRPMFRQKLAEEYEHKGPITLLASCIRRAIRHGGSVKVSEKGQYMYFRRNRHNQNNNNQGKIKVTRFSEVSRVTAYSTIAGQYKTLYIDSYDHLSEDLHALLKRHYMVGTASDVRIMFQKNGRYSLNKIFGIEGSNRRVWKRIVRNTLDGRHSHGHTAVHITLDKWIENFDALVNQLVDIREPEPLHSEPVTRPPPF
jgi:hypothetical protein